MALWQKGMKQERLKMIEQAMIDKSPRVHHHIKVVEQGLPEFLEITEEALMTNFQWVKGQAEKEVSQIKLDPMEMTKELNSRIKVIWEISLANYLEFPESLYLPDQED